MERGPDRVENLPGRPRYVSIEIARGLAACSVLLFHVGARLGQSSVPFEDTPARDGLIPAGLGTLSSGVAVFFAITGFVIGGPIVRTAITQRTWNVRSYTLRRLARIVPAYWVALTVLAIYPGLHGVFTGDWWIYYGFAQVYGSHTTDGLGPAWTLCIEMVFYAVLPFILILLGRPLLRRLRPARRVDAVLAFVVLSAIVSLTYARWRFQVPISGDARQWSMYTLVGTWVWFTPGLMLAVAVAAPDHWFGQIGRRIDRMRALPALAIAGLLGGLLAFALTQRHVTGDPLPQFAAQALIGGSGLALAFAVRHRGGILATSFLLTLGTISYGIYLWHDPIIVAVKRALDLGAQEPLTMVALATVIAFAVTVAAAQMSYRFIERPIMRLSHGSESQGLRPDRVAGVVDRQHLRD